MSPSIEPALLFWCLHWDDMNNLADRNERPENVAPSDWSKFQDVVEHATQGVVDLLSMLDQQLERTDLGELVLQEKRNDTRTMRSDWYCQRRIAIRAPGGARQIGGLWFGIARTREAPQPVFVVAFFFERNGREVGDRYVQLARDIRPNLILRFATEVIEDTSRWSVVLSMEPITSKTTMESLLDKLTATASDFAATKRQLIDALG